MRALVGACETEGDASMLIALASPHAGLPYSGRVAAFGYRLLQAVSVDTVILVGPSHHVGFDGSSVYPAGGFETPLGAAAVDEEIAGSLLACCSTLQGSTEPHEREHSLEMQLPFIQVLAPRALIVPILMGSQRRRFVDDLAAGMVGAVRAASKRILIVASSDLSHYNTRLVAARLDGKVLDLLSSFDADGLMRLLEANPDHACGGGPMVAVMKAARELGASASRVLAYADSADVTGDERAVVGYASAAFFRRA